METIIQSAPETATEEPSYVLKMQDINKAFPGVQALDKVQLKLRPGSIHALLGENGAGKSTLMKVLFGIYSKDSGEVILNGNSVNFSSAKQALDNGVSMVHQELNQVRTTRIVDNLWLGRFPTKGPFIDEQKMVDDTKAIFDSLDIHLDPRAKIRDLSVSSCQMVEIAKAVSYNAKIIVMDEPTSSLTENEVAHLFRILRTLRDKGTAIIYISHKMDEIKQIADEVTIFRDGKYVGTYQAKEITIDEIIRKMVGRNFENWFPPKTNTPYDVQLEVEDFTSTNPRSFKNITFNLHKGEILGIAGLVGSQRTELVESIFGFRSIASGTLVKDGKKIQNRNPREAIDNGFALVTEERRATGIFGVSDITFNSVISNLKSYVSKALILNDKKMTADTAWSIGAMDIKTPSQKTKISSLSGGNQQKVILGRWLLTQPDILLMDEPTRGIDVGAKYEIYQLMINLASEGKSVIMVSSEMPELLGVTDRIAVMSNGQLAGIITTKNATQEEIMTLAAKYL
ncbi:MAG: ATP-binding cassette domain-containing protein [Anaerolineaceae bacterium]|nr:ATP-binding cassette domain-containing protein [Anaerolineaceae bacterium]